VLALTNRPALDLEQAKVFATVLHWLEDAPY